MNGTRTSSDAAIDILSKYRSMLSTSASARVEVQRLAQRLTGRGGSCARDDAARSRASASALRNSGCSSARALARLHDAAHREQPLGRIVGRQRAQPARERRAGSGAPPAPRARRARGRQGLALQRRRPRGDLVLAVAAEQLVGALAGERDRDVLARQPAEQQEAEAGDVGDRLLEVPERLVEQRRVVGGAGQRARGGRCRGARATRARVGRARWRRASSAKPIEKVWTGRSRRSAISAVIRLESRPPLSITPSGTSLIIRARTAVAQQLEQLLLVLLPATRPARGRRRPTGSSRRAASSDLAVLPDQQRGRRRACARRRTACAGPARSRRPGRARRRAGRARGSDEAAGEQRLDLGGEGEPVAGDGVVERLDAHAVARQHEPPARLVPQRDREHPAQPLGRSRGRTPRRGARSSPSRRAVASVWPRAEQLARAARRKLKISPLKTAVTSPSSVATG